MKKIDKLLYEERKEFYERYPDYFVEFITGMKLSWFERCKLRMKCRIQCSFEKLIWKLRKKRQVKGKYYGLYN